MSRNPEIEAILEAWRHADTCIPAERSSADAELNRLLDSVCAKSLGQFNRSQILDHLWSQYRDYRRQKRREEQIKIAQHIRK